MSSLQADSTRRAVQALRSRLQTAQPRVALSLTIISMLLLAFAFDRLATTLVLSPTSRLLFHMNHRPLTPTIALPADAPYVATDLAFGASDSSPSSSTSKPPLPPIDYKALPMHRPEVDLLLSYLLPTDSYLEYGASATALHIAPRVATAVAVAPAEPSACAAVTAAIPHSSGPNPANLRFLCAGPQPAHDPIAHPHADAADDATAPYLRFQAFVDAPLLPPQPRPRARHGAAAAGTGAAPPAPRFDKVLIDGPARLACALRVLPYLRPSSRVFIHDAFARPARYAPLLDYYVEVSRVVAHGAATGEPGGLLVLKPRYDQGEDAVPGAVLSSQTIAALEHVGARGEREGVADGSSRVGGLEDAFRFIGATNSSGYDKEAHSAAAVWRNSVDRIVLDLFALPLLVLAYNACLYVYSLLFEDAMKCHFADHQFVPLRWVFGRQGDSPLGLQAKKT